MDRFKFKVGDLVVKERGDYTYRGWVVSRYRKRSGVARYVVENIDGLNYIMALVQLRPMTALEASCFLTHASMLRVEPDGKSVEDTTKRLSTEIGDGKKRRKSKATVRSMRRL